MSPVEKVKKVGELQAIAVCEIFFKDTFRYI